MDIWTAVRTVLQKSPGIQAKYLIPQLWGKTGLSRGTIYDHLRSFVLRGMIFREKGRYWLEKPQDEGMERKLFRQEYKIRMKHSRLLLANEELKHCEMFEGEITAELILEQMLHHEEDFGEIFCLKQHFRTGYHDDLWLPLQDYHELMKKYDYPIVPEPNEFLQVAYGISTNLQDVFGELPKKERDQLMELKKNLLITLYRIMIDVRHGIPLGGQCDHCPPRRVSVPDKTQQTK